MITAISARKYGQLKRMSDAYDWADDASRCYDLAIKTLRDRYLKERHEGETAAHWEARIQSRRTVLKQVRGDSSDSNVNNGLPTVLCGLSTVL